MTWLIALPFVTLLTGCGLYFGSPMERRDFDRAKAACELTGASFEQGSFLKGKPATIHAPRGVSPSSWDENGGCVARLFGGNGVDKAPHVNFMFRFNS